MQTVSRFRRTLRVTGPWAPLAALALIGVVVAGFALGAWVLWILASQMTERTQVSVVLWLVVLVLATGSVSVNGAVKRLGPPIVGTLVWAVFLANALLMLWPTRPTEFYALVALALIGLATRLRKRLR